MVRVLVCGGRDYDDWETIKTTLDGLSAKYGAVDAVIYGAATGADSLVREWAKLRRVPHIGFPAEWPRLGKAAGPLRNQRMLADGKPDLVVAFPGGRGTADMVRRAKAAGVEVVEINS